MENLFYSNNINVGMSQDDITLDFLYISPNNASNSETVQPISRNRVVLSPTQAKKLTQLLVNSISTYEKIYGVINLTPNMEELKKFGVNIEQKEK